MVKEGYITAGLCRIKDQLADTALPSVEKTGSENAPPVSVLEKLPEETRKAWRERLKEYELMRRDLLFRLHEFEAKISRMEAGMDRQLRELKQAREQFAPLLTQLEQQSEPDEYAEDFQLKLSGACRELDRIRLELIQVQSLLPESEQTPAGKNSANLFAELDSVSFGQLFRIGSALLLPVLLTILFGSLLIGLAIVLTFRIGL